MKKPVVDLSVEDLNELASQAWATAARKALAKGLPVTGSRDGRRIRYFPDGRTEDLGSVQELPESVEGADTSGARKSVA